MVDEIARERRRARRQRQKELQAAKRRASQKDAKPMAASKPSGELPQVESKGPREIQEKDITGLKYFDKIAPLLERLHDDACARDKAGNRDLHFDQYCMLILLYLFNPIVTSLRGIQQASELEKVQRKLGCTRAALGSLSEAASVFDPERLKEIISELGRELQPLGRNTQLKDLDQTLTLVESDWLYVMDRGYAKFTLFNKIVAARSSYVCRLRDNSAYDILEEKQLTDTDRAAGVLSDQIVRLGKSGKADTRPDHPIRLICVKCSPHTSRGKYRGGSSGVDSDGILRIATNLLDVPAELIALIYSERWAIEIFFRFFKHILGCRRTLLGRGSFFGTHS